MLPLPAPGIRFYELDENAMLFVPGTDRLVVLNSTAAAIWCLLQEADSLTSLVRSLTDYFRIPSETAQADLNRAFSLFDREGLLISSTQPSPSPSPKTALPDLDQQSPPMTPPAKWPFAQTFHLPGCTLSFCCQDQTLAKTTASLLEHLKINQPPQAGIASEEASIWVMSGNGKTKSADIALNGRIFFKAVPDSAILPHILLIMFTLCCRGLSPFLLFHAAVIVKEEKALLLAGVVGSGKTTLSAAAAQSGWRFCSDELAIIDPATSRVKPCPLPMSIKEGSTATVSRFYPSFEQEAQHQRPDGKTVRYLAPPADSTASFSDSFDVAAILFPRFQEENATPSPERLDKPTALQYLAATGSSDRALTDADIQTMITLVNQAPCFTFTHGTDIDASLSRMESILAGDDVLPGGQAH